ncbi:zinc finger protein 546-like [Chanos chanos]|uniref:Zinc finger protein 546-like n=1 Tax=Chanos chanos TaxID=29144 RepID=A0A6J2VK80_CHACN|nr:zinc finger protein 546-like [Chanos chanos]
MHPLVQLVLELCRLESLETIQSHLDKIRAPIALSGEPGLQSSDAEVEASESNFIELVQVLLKDPAERTMFFQEVFPVEYGQKFDVALQKLMWVFLSKLEEALPMPNIAQIASMLSTNPAVMEECVQSLSHHEHLKNLLQHHKNIQQLEPKGIEEVQVETIHIVDYTEIEYETSTGQFEEKDKEADRTTKEEQRESELKDMGVKEGVAQNDGGLIIEEMKPAGELDVTAQVERPATENQQPLIEETVLPVGAERTERVNSGKVTCGSKDENTEEVVMDKTDEGTPNEPEQQSQEREESSLTLSSRAKPDKTQLKDTNVSSLVNACISRQPAVKLDRLDVTDKPLPLPWYPTKPKIGCPGKETEPLNKNQQIERHEPNVTWVVPPPLEKLMGPLKPDQNSGKTGTAISAPAVAFACTLCSFSDPEEFNLHHHLIVTHPEEYKRLWKAGTQRAINTEPTSGASQHPANEVKVSAPVRTYRRIPVSKTCPVCGKTFTRGADMRRHQRTHAGERPYPCNECGRCFKLPSELRNHQEHTCENEHLEELGKLEEHKDVSAQGSSNSSQLHTSQNKTSREQTPASTPASTTCPVCGLTFTRPTFLKRHMISHTTERPYSCSQCGKSYRYVDSLRVHELVCQEADSTEPQNMVHQEVCGEQETQETISENASDLSQTLGDKPQKRSPSLGSSCQSCEKAPSTRSSDTRRHSQSVKHPYQCSQCGMGYKYSYNLEKHQDVCQGTKPSQNSVQTHSPKDKKSLSVETDDHATSLTLTGASEGSSPLSATPDSHQMFERNDQNICVGKIDKSDDVVAHKKPVPCANCGKEIGQCDGQRCKRPPEHRHRCVKCGMFFRTLAEVKKHLRNHWGDDPLRCSQCGRAFQSTSQLAKHKQIHAIVLVFQCTLCSDTFVKLESLRQHYLQAHDIKRDFPCSHCEKSFIEVSSLVKHLRTHTGERPYQCSQCPKRFKLLTALEIHEKTHTGIKKFLCAECGKFFATVTELSRHEVRHSNERPHVCSQCGKTFKAERTMKEHLQRHFGKQQCYSCSYCGKLFARAFTLQRHNRTHTGERPYSCTKCGKTFLTSGEVAKHQRYHTGERPFKCTVCLKSFTQSCYLTLHMRVHTGERPYPCGVCAKRFSSRTHLNRHMMIHTGEKPYVCDCGKAFNRMNLLNIHKRTHVNSK